MMIYCKNHDMVIFLAYVDNILVTKNNTVLMDSIITQLNAEFSLKELCELGFFLDIEVARTEESFHLSQTKYITNLFDRVPT